MSPIPGVLHTAMLLYMLTAAISLYCAWEFYRTKDGKLRLALINLFLFLGIALMIRGGWGLCALEMRVKLNPWISLFAISLVFISFIRFLFIIKRYTKDDRK